MRPKKMLDQAAAALGFTLALYPMLVWYLRRLGDGSDEPLGLVALAAAAAFAWFGRRQLLPPGRSGKVAAIVLLAVYGWLAWAGCPPLLRAIPALAAIACWYGLWRLPAVIALLILSLPLMASLQFFLGYPLRLVTAQASTTVLNLFQVGVVREGAQLVHHGVAVGVDPPCSGLRMLWASAFLAAAVAGKLKLSWRGIFALGSAALALAIAANIVRASLLFFPEAQLVNLPHWMHQGTGNACFAAGAILLIALANRLQPDRALAV